MNEILYIQIVGKGLNGALDECINRQGKGSSNENAFFVYRKARAVSVHLTPADIGEKAAHQGWG